MSGSTGQRSEPLNALQIVGRLQSIDYTPRDDRFGITGSSDTTKVLRWEVDGLTTATTRTRIARDVSGNEVVDSFANIFSAMQTINSTLLVSLSGAAPSVPLTNVSFSVVGTPAANALLQAQSYGGSCYYIGYRTNGTPGAPTGVTGGQIINGFAAGGRNNIGGYVDFTAQVNFSSTETYTSGAGYGTRILFSCTPTGSTTSSEVMRCQEAALAIGGLSPVLNSGRIQLPSGTGIADGALFGDVGLFRNGTLSFTIDAINGLRTTGARYHFGRTYASASGATALVGTDEVFESTGTTAFTLTLPAATAGRRVRAYNGNTAGNVTVARAGSDTINGGTASTTLIPGAAAEFDCIVAGSWRRFMSA